MKKAIQIHRRDNVATVSAVVSVSEEVEILSPQGEIFLKMKPKENLLNGHKLALKSLARGEEIIKYGEVIGIASQPIAAGDWVHTHNVESDRMSLQEKEAN
jgi:hypothetical protein